MKKISETSKLFFFFLHFLKQDLEQIVEVFLGQFRQLFGFKSEAIYTTELGSYKILPSERGFTEW